MLIFKYREKRLGNTGIGRNLLKAEANEIKVRLKNCQRVNNMKWLNNTEWEGGERVVMERKSDTLTSHNCFCGL